MVSIGIDTHKASLAVSVVDELGRQLATRTVGNDPRGHAALLTWIQRQAAPRRVGIEGAGSFGAALAEVLVAAGEAVVEVPAQFTDRERRALLQRGKSDPGDALAIARLTAREPHLPALRRPGVIADLKLLVVARDQLIGERTRLVNQLHADLLVLLPGYGAQLPNLTAARHQATAARLLRRHDSVRAELARGRMRRLRQLTAEAERLEQRIGALLAASGSTLPRLAGVGALTAAKLLGETGDVVATGARLHLRRPAAPRRCRPRPASVSGTGSIAAATVSSTVRCTRWLWCSHAGSRARVTIWLDARLRARADSKRCVP